MPGKLVIGVVGELRREGDGLFHQTFSFFFSPLQDSQRSISFQICIWAIIVSKLTKAIYKYGRISTS